MPPPSPPQPPPTSSSPSDRGRRVVGVVVDSVSDVLTLKREEIKEAPAFSTALNAEFITGLGTVDGRMVILSDIEKLITDPDMALVREPFPQAA